MTSVSNIADLNSAIAAADAASSGTVTIDIAADISLGGTALEAINLQAGVTLDIEGGGNTLDGGGGERGLFVYAGTVDISDLTLIDTAATGGSGGGGGGGAGGEGGGGAGLGGGLFVGSAVDGDAGNVTLTNVSFSNESATGGSVSASTALQAGAGGGGLGGAGGGGSTVGGGAGGDIGLAGAPANGGAGGARLQPGAAGGVGGGGGGGGSGNHGTNIGRPGGSGGFGGGGGGGGNFSLGAAGGFGGGGGGGGGGNGTSFGGAGGFGGGAGGNGANAGNGGGGGGGLGAGGDIFIMGGASLTIEGALTAADGTVTGGSGGTPAGAGAGGAGSGFGSGIFLHSANGGSTSITFAPGDGETETVAGVIADMTGSGGTGPNAGMGSLVVNGSGTLVLSATNTYTGGTTLEAGTVYLVANGAAGSGAITLSTTTANVLTIGTADTPASGTTFANTLDDFDLSATLDLQGLPYVDGDTTATVVNGDTLQVNDGTTSLAFLLAGMVGGAYQTASDGASGTLITACFASGTLISTARGAVDVATLRDGDMVVGLDGEHLPVVWLGHRRTDCARHPRPWDVWPVRVAAHAFGPNRPERDLRLSPDHAVFVVGATADDAMAGGTMGRDAMEGGVLIPVRYLVNGATVVQEPTDEVVYWHVELQRHAVLLAEGLPCESYLDTGNRDAFDNAGAVVSMHAKFDGHADAAAGTPEERAWRTWEKNACARLVCSGPGLSAARRALLERLPSLGHAITNDPALRVIVDHAEMPSRRDGNRLRVALPRDATELRLLSRTTVPAELDMPGGDTRRLGVAVTGLALDGEDVALFDPRLGEGWLAPEPGLRWTAGNAAIDVSGVAVVDLCLAPIALLFHQTVASGPAPVSRAA